jgi:DNA processing protein
MAESDQTTLWQLAIFGCVDGIGRRTLRKALKYRTEQRLNWCDLWVPTPAVCTFLSLTTKQIESIQKSDKEQFSNFLAATVTKHKLRLIGAECAEYPPLLKESDDPPPVLFVKGAQMQWSPGNIPIAIVGTRNITAYGRLVTEKIASELADLGCIIVSGLMYGVDSVAHLTTVGTGGITIAVLGYGFDHCYPEEHQPVMDELLAKGATLISEYPPWKIAKKGNFPARNSIVAGMSAAVVVTEAAKKSGSMITAQCAVDEGRAVCAVPGPITNPYCEGTKWLINEGATLVSSGTEVLEQIYRPTMVSTKLFSSPKQRQIPSNVSAIGQHILHALMIQSQTFDELANSLELNSTTLLAELSQLELSGLLINEAGRLSAP